MKKKNKPLDKSSKQFPKIAKALIKIMKDVYDIAITMDSKGIKKLDDFIWEKRERGTKHDGMIFAIGIFIGECIIKRDGGEWYNGGDGNPYDWCIKYNALVTNPFNKVIQQFDGHESISEFYEVSAKFNEVFKSLNLAEKLN